MYKRKMLWMLKNQLGIKYEGNIAGGKFGNVVQLKMPSGEMTAGKIVSGERIKQNEMEYWHLLDHKNIVQLTKTILAPEENACCFVMPRHYMTLEQIMSTGWFQEDEDNIFDIKRWILDTLSGVEYLHHHNLCHLNIHTNNVLVSYNSIAKLGGFKFVSPSTQPISE